MLQVLAQTSTETCHASAPSREDIFGNVSIWENATSLLDILSFHIEKKMGFRFFFWGECHYLPLKGNKSRHFVTERPATPFSSFRFRYGDVGRMTLKKYPVEGVQ